MENQSEKDVRTSLDLGVDCKTHPKKETDLQIEGPASTSMESTEQENKEDH